jgi:hypothetical protein
VPTSANAPRPEISDPIPAAAGIGLRLSHLTEVAEAPDATAPRAAWFEIHSETFLCDGGPRLAMLDEVRRRYRISCHGVGLSLGSAQCLDDAHLRRLRRLFARVKPELISDHLSWSVVDGAYLNDLLPLPYSEDALRVVGDNIARAQEAFGRQILVENPSSYLHFVASTMPEWEFLSALVARTGCGLLLDVNNIYVSAINNGFDPAVYLQNVPAAAVHEIHLAGHSIEDDGDARVLVDTHSTHVCDQVWALYRQAIARLGRVPTLIEWDMNIPAFADLQAEAARADAVMAEALKTEESRRVA